MNEQCTGGDVNSCPVHGPDYRETIRQAGIAEGRRLERERGVEVEIMDLVDGTCRIYTRNGEPVPHSGTLIPSEPTP